MAETETTDETETSASRDRDETETLTIFLDTRPRRDVGTSRDRAVETETTTLLHNSIKLGYLRIRLAVEDCKVLRL